MMKADESLLNVEKQPEIGLDKYIATQMPWMYFFESGLSIWV